MQISHKNIDQIDQFIDIEDVINNNLDSGKHIVFQVLNSVIGDSRVIKVAKTAMNLGYRVTMLGMSRTKETVYTEIEGISIILIVNPTYPLLKVGKHERDMSKRNYKEFVDQYFESSKNILLDLKPDLIHTHDMYGIEIGYLYKKFLGEEGLVIPWIHDIHEYILGLDHVPYNIQEYTKTFERLRVFDPDFLFTVTEELADKLHEYYRLPQRPVVLTNSPKIEFFDEDYQNTIKKNIGLTKKDELAVYVGRVSKERGVDTVINALPYIDNLHFVIVTNQKDKYREYLISLAKQLNVQDRFHIRDYVPNEEVSSYIQDADIGVNPLTSYGNSNVSIPTKVSEYIHAGLPIVSSRLDAMENFLNEYKIGEMHEPENVEEIVSAIRKVISNKKFYIKNIDDSLKYNRSWNKAEDELKIAYEDLFNEYYQSDDGQIKIFHGFSGAANQPSTISQAEKKLGYKSDFGCFSVGNAMDYDRDFELLNCNVQYNIPFYINKLSKKYNVFHYYFRTFYQMPDFRFPSGIDALALKADRKTLIMTFQGSEVRYHSQFKRDCPFNYVDENPSNIISNFPEKRQREFINYCRSIFDSLVVLDPEMQTYIPDSIIINRAVDTEKFDFIGLATDEEQWKEEGPHIVHIPSRTTVKGSHFLEEALNKLENDGVKFRYTFATGLSHAELKELYDSADIIVDQLRIGWYGVASVEAMSLGKAVVCYIREDLKHHVSELDRIMVNANPNTIYEELIEIIKDRKRAEKLGEMARKFVLKNHDSEVIAKQYIQLYKDKRDTPTPINFGLLNKTFMNQLTLEQASRNTLVVLNKKVAGINKAITAKATIKPTTITAELEKAELGKAEKNIELVLREKFQNTINLTLGKIGLQTKFKVKQKKGIFDYPLKKAPFRVLKKIKKSKKS